MAAIKAIGEGAIEELLKLQLSHCISQSLYCICKARIPNIIGQAENEQALTAAEIAQKCTNIKNIGYLERMMRQLSAYGIFDEEQRANTHEPAFKLNVKSMLLRTDLDIIPSISYAISHLLDSSSWASWSRMEECLYSEGEQYPFNLQHGMHIFQYYKANPLLGELFNTSMSVLAKPLAQEVVEAYEQQWKRYEKEGKTIVDLGGSEGVIMGTLKINFPNLRCLSLDLPEVTNTLKEDKKQDGVEYVVGNFFDSKTIPKCDVIFLRNILHDWNDEDSVKILIAARDALKEDTNDSDIGGEILVCEFMLPEIGKNDLSHQIAFSVDLWMLNIGGKERTRKQYENIFNCAGLRLHDLRCVNKLVGVYLFVVKKQNDTRVDISGLRQIRL